MMIREPAVAGRFYPLSRDACLREIAAMRPPAPPPEAPARPVGGIVPHAGWVFSGETALAVIRTLAERRKPKTFVIFGASHMGSVRGAILFGTGAWQTPLGLAEIDERLAKEILARASDLVANDPEGHDDEHSIEVQIPLIQHVAPGAKIVPILVPPGAQPVALGRAVGAIIAGLEADAVVLGSSDLTHYGPAYRFTPQGMGAGAMRWVRDENDRRMLDLAVALDADAVVPEAKTRMNACGPGAIAATLAAARGLGATRGCVVQYTTSYDVMREKMGREDAEAAVGYGGVVF
jgi:AmmeMemoRadiSam system protein B